MDFSHFSALVVEDNDFVRFMIKKYLTEFGFAKIFEASSGKDGLDLLIQQKPDIVICDINMEKGDGFDFLISVRKLDSPLAQLPIIFLTSHADEAFVRKAVEMKVDAYLLKPVMPNNLKTKLASLMAKKMSA